MSLKDINACPLCRQKYTYINYVIKHWWGHYIFNFDFSRLYFVLINVNQLWNIFWHGDPWSHTNYLKQIVSSCLPLLHRITYNSTNFKVQNIRLSRWNVKDIEKWVQSIFKRFLVCTAREVPRRLQKSSGVSEYAELTFLLKY